MATKCGISEAKLHKIEHNSGPVHRSFKIFAARVGLSWSGISIMLLKFSREVAMATKFCYFIGKLHKIEHNIGPMHRTFQIFVASVGLCLSLIHI